MSLMLEQQNQQPRRARSITKGLICKVIPSWDFVSVVVALFTQTRSCSLSNAARIRGVRPTPVENPGTSGFPWLGT